MRHTEKTKILMIIAQYLPIVGGAQKECQNQAEMLSKKGLQVIILTQHVKGLPEYEEINGIPVYRKIKAFKPWGISYVLSVLRFLVRKRRLYNIIQCFGIYYYTPASILMKYIFKKKVVNRLECAGQKGDLKRIETMKYRFLIELSWKKGDAIVAISKEIYEDLVNCGVHKDKIVYIPNSVDTAYYAPCTLKTWDSPMNILFAGRLTEQKGVNILLRAVKQVVEKGFKDLSLIIAGDGPLRKELEETVNDLAIAQFVKFVGNTDDVIQYYHNSHILAIPSNWEGLPLVLLEGMACGLAVVASDLGGNREGIQDGTNGLLFAPGKESELSSKIIYFLEHPEISKQMGQISRKKAVDHFSLEKNILKYVELYQSLLVQ